MSHSERKKSKSNVRSKQRAGRSSFAICVDNREYPASLERGKVYKALTDSFASQHGLVRVIDESGEDYLFSQKLFRPITLPRPIVRALSNAA